MFSLIQNYLTSLGLSRTAQVKRDARIGEAEARRDATIRVPLSCSVVSACSYRKMSVSSFVVVLLLSKFLCCDEVINGSV